MVFTSLPCFLCVEHYRNFQANSNNEYAEDILGHCSLLTTH